MHTRPPEGELPYSVRPQKQIDPMVLNEPIHPDVSLYTAAGMLTLVSLNARAGMRANARRLLADPRISVFRLRRLFWRVVCLHEWTAAFAIGTLVRARSVTAGLRSVRR